MLKKVLFLALTVAVVVSVSHGSTTRLQTLQLGGFIKDDSDMFMNPALLAHYPNLVIGELGVYSDYEYKQEWYCPCQWMAVTAGKGTLTGGLVWNREIPIVDEIDMFNNMEYPFYSPPRPINPIEAMVSYSNDGMAFGGRAYLAGGGYDYEEKTDGDVVYEEELGSSVWDFAGGFAMDLGNNSEMDAYVNVGLFSFSGTETYPDDTLNTEYDCRSEGGKYIEAGGRGFFPVKRGMRMVPLVKFHTGSFTYTYERDRPDTTWEDDYSRMSLQLGVGAETQLSRSSMLGAGVSFVYATEKVEWHDGITDETTHFILPLFQAGLEASLTKWFIARIGVQKVHAKVTDKWSSESPGLSGKQDYEWTDTYTDSESLSDFLALGFGIKLDRLLFDATLREEIPFTGTYLLSGIARNLSGKITATYHF